MFLLVNKNPNLLTICDNMELEIPAKLELIVKGGVGYRAHLSQEYIIMEFASSVCCQSVNVLTS